MKRLRAYWVGQAKWWCSRNLEWWAARLTGFYLAGAFVIMGAKFDELIVLKLNEIGDLAAGVFGPVAFLWLVFGYIQQGRELKLSSAALGMQAVELKASVDQQKELVGISTEHFNMARDNARFENARLAASIEPKFSIAGWCGSETTEGSKFDFRVMNGGYAITCFFAYFNREEVCDMGMFLSGQKITISKVFEVGENISSGIIYFSYLNGLEDRKYRKFNVVFKRSDEGWDVEVLPKNGELCEVLPI